MLRVGRQAQGFVCALGGHPWVTELVNKFTWTWKPSAHQDRWERSGARALAVAGRVGSRARSSPGPDC